MKLSDFASMPVSQLRALDRERARLAIAALGRDASQPGIEDATLDGVRERLAAVRDVLTPALAGEESDSQIFARSDRFEAAGDGSLWFWKDAARFGEYVHPSAGYKFSLSAERAAAIARESNRYLSSVGTPLPLPNGHDTGDATKNLGWVWGFEIRGERLGFVCEATSEKAKAEVGRSARWVSMSVSPEISNERGNVFRDVITHVALTSEPALTDQKNFEPLLFSRDAKPFVEARGAANEEQEGEMFQLTKEAAEAVNLSREASADAISAKLVELARTKDALSAERDALKTEVQQAREADAARVQAEFTKLVDDSKSAAAKNKRAEAWGRVEPTVKKLWEAGLHDEARAFAKLTVGERSKAPGSDEVNEHAPEAVERKKYEMDHRVALFSANGWSIKLDQDGHGFTRSRKRVDGTVEKEHERFEVVTA